MLLTGDWLSPELYAGPERTKNLSGRGVMGASPTSIWSGPTGRRHVHRPLPAEELQLPASHRPERRRQSSDSLDDYGNVLPLITARVVVQSPIRKSSPEFS